MSDVSDATAPTFETDIKPLFRESDRDAMQPALDELEARGISCELEVRSAHRNPDAVAEYARGARDRGTRVLIAGAGLAAALPGAVAAQTDLSVIGVPLRSRLSVLDGRRWARYFPDDEQAEQEDTQRQAPTQGDDTST